MTAKYIKLMTQESYSFEKTKYSLLTVYYTALQPYSSSKYGRLSILYPFGYVINAIYSFIKIIVNSLLFVEALLSDDILANSREILLNCARETMATILYVINALALTITFFTRAVASLVEFIKIKNSHFNKVDQNDISDDENENEEVTTMFDRCKHYDEKCDIINSSRRNLQYLPTKNYDQFICETATPLFIPPILSFFVYGGKKSESSEENLADPTIPTYSEYDNDEEHPLR